MKYLILTFTFFCFASLKANGQTKEETIKWISEKIEGYGWISWNQGTLTKIDQDITIEGSKVIIHQKSTSERDGDSWDETFTFNLEMLYGYNTFFLNDSGTGLISLFFKNNSIIHNTYDNKKEEETKFQLHLNWIGEDGLQRRFIRALDNLIRFNKESSPKEIY